MAKGGCRSVAVSGAGKVCKRQGYVYLDLRIDILIQIMVETQDTVRRL